MKTSILIVMAFVSLVSFNSNAALTCSDKKCDVKWEINDLHRINLSTVCYTYNGKKEYKECRNLAVQVFKSKCDRATKNHNVKLMGTYCDQAVKDFVP